MAIKIQIVKGTAQGEQFVVDIGSVNPVTGQTEYTSIGDMCQMADEALRLADVRLLEMNTRMLEAYNLEQYFDPAQWARVVSILDILCGRQSIDTVARRWQSEREENAALAQLREEYHQQYINGSSHDQNT